MFSAFKFLAEESKRAKEKRQELYEIISICTGVELKWQGTAKTEQSNRPKSNAELEFKLSQMGFKIG